MRNWRIYLQVEILEVVDNYLKEVENEEELRLSGSECEEFTEEARTVGARKDPVDAEKYQEIKPSYEQQRAVDHTEEVVKEKEAKKNKPKKKLKQKNITKTGTKGTIKMKENKRLMEQAIEADEKGQI